MKAKIKKLGAWAKRHKSQLLFAAALFVIIGTATGVLFALQVYQMPKLVNIPASVKKKPPEAPKYYSPLTGVLVADEATTKRPVTAIMIENSTDARPQSGLKQAGVVFETIAEGGITRFVTFFQEAQPGLIGPVRSVRPYYVEWAAAFDAGLVHIGGSYKALQMTRSGNYGLDLDQFFNGSYFWRATDRYAPHNVYTNFTKMNALNAAKGKTTSTFTAWDRKDDKPSKTPNATVISLPISSGAYNVGYNYDAASNSYLRSQSGVAHNDREEGRLAPKVVIALKVPITLGFEDGYREQINTIGSGAAEIFQDGTVQEVTWTKTDAKKQISFTDAAGKPVALNRGQTWVTALDPSKAVTWQ